MSAETTPAFNPVRDTGKITEFSEGKYTRHILSENGRKFGSCRIGKIFFYSEKENTMLTVKAKLMDEASMHRTLIRMAHEIVEKNETDELCFVGIHRRGLPLAEELAQNVTKFSGISTVVGSVDITLHRDDRGSRTPDPTVSNTRIEFPIEGKTVILVDDVICTGRTIRAAMDALVGFGRPAKIQLAVLVDRGHRELPIRGDFVGKNVPTSKKESIAVRVPEYDGEAGVYVCESKED